MWTPKGKRPIVLTSGSHQNTCVFGALCIDGQQFFRQYSTFNQDTFLQYLKELQRKFRKLILFLDRAAQHYRSSKVKKHLEESKGVIRVEYLPKGSPGLMLLKNAGGKEKMNFLYQDIILNFEI
jgi:hypothetical protein